MVAPCLPCPLPTPKSYSHATGGTWDRLGAALVAPGTIPPSGSKDKEPWEVLRGEL